MLSYTYATVFLVALLLSRSVAPFVADLAVRLGAVDLPSARKVHRGVVPRLGGVALLLGMLAPLVLLFIVDTDVARQFRDGQNPLLGLFAGLVPIVILGLVDDLRGTGALVKLPVQIAAAVIAYAGGCRIAEFSNPFGGTAYVLGAMSLPVTVLWIVVVTNAINLIDGLDGLATGIIAFVAATLFALSKENGHVAVAAVALSLCGAAIGFLRYNFPPASIFLGDTGSLSAGFLIACISVLGAHKTSTAVALFVPVVVLGVPLFDTITSLLRRILHSKHPFRADAEHIHHRILARGVSHLRATLTLYAVTGVLMALALLVAYFDSRGSLKPMGWTLFATAGFLLTVGGVLGYLNVAELRVHAATGAQTRRMQKQRRRTIETCRRTLDELLQDDAGGSGAKIPTAVWEVLAEQIEQHDFVGYQIHVVGEPEDRSNMPATPAGSDVVFHARALVVGGCLEAQIVVISSGGASARTAHVEVLDELVQAFAGAIAAWRSNCAAAL